MGQLNIADKVHEYYCGWIGPDGTLYDKTLFVRTHEHIASMILSQLFGTSITSCPPEIHLMVTNKLMTDRGFVRYDWETIWRPDEITVEQRRILNRLARLNGPTPIEKFNTHWDWIVGIYGKDNLTYNVEVAGITTTYTLEGVHENVRS